MPNKIIEPIPNLVGIGFFIQRSIRNNSARIDDLLGTKKGIETYMANN